ncbi:hypothetical protein BSBH6_01245 [Bacillus subtilis]|nr:hypothetical protein BSBH6_01245 [Bacillus subtilis]RPK18550.1 hypothetical protein BH5_01243 [Bacillus subtilis]
MELFENFILFLQGSNGGFSSLISLFISIFYPIFKKGQKKSKMPPLFD